MSHSLLWAKEYKLSDEVYECLSDALKLAKQRKQEFVSSADLFLTIVEKDPGFYRIEYKRLLKAYQEFFPEGNRTLRKILFSPRIKNLIKEAVDLKPGREVKEPTILHIMMITDHGTSARMILERAGYDDSKLSEIYRRYHDSLLATD